MSNMRNYIQARNLKKEAEEKLKDFEAIIGRVRQEYKAMSLTGIACPAFDDGNGKPIAILVTRSCWNHIFDHPVKRRSRVEKLERALSWDFAVKLIKKTVTYQEVSRERDRGGNEYTSFGIIGYVRGNRIKVIVKRQNKTTNPKYTLYSFYQMSQAPVIKMIPSDGNL